MLLPRFLKIGRHYRRERLLGNKGKLVFAALDLHTVHFTKAILEMPFSGRLAFKKAK